MANPIYIGYLVILIYNKKIIFLDIIIKYKTGKEWVNLILYLFNEDC